MNQVSISNYSQGYAYIQESMKKHQPGYYAIKKILWSKHFMIIFQHDHTCFFIYHEYS